MRDPRHRISLGEGGTPLLSLPRLGRELGLEHLLAKDEGLNPTGSFKARGLAAAVSRARELGAEKLALPTAGNAGSALAAYCARAGLEAVIYMPDETPEAFIIECRRLGAEVIQVPGTISDAGAALQENSAGRDWFDLSTLREPYRLDGKKTMGLELAEQLGWRLPQVILYPTGGGTGLLGMWNAFDELERAGLIDGGRPRMVAVQARDCAPVVRAFETGADRIEAWCDARTLASGLRVPRPFADIEILSVLRASDGTAVTVTDATMLKMLERLAVQEGIYASPEAAATLAAAAALRDAGELGVDENVVVFLTGNAYKYQSEF